MWERYELKDEITDEVKLVYELKNGKYHLVRDERLSSVITSDEVYSNPNSICANDYWWR